MHRRAVFPLLEIGDQSVRGSLASIDAALTRLLALAQTNLKDLGLATRVKEKAIDCAMLSKSKQLKFRLKFELVSKEELQLMDDSENSNSDYYDDVSPSSSGGFSRTNSSESMSLARSKERESSDADHGVDHQLPPRIGSGSSAALERALEEDGQHQWLVSAELLVGDPPQFDKVFRRLCAKCSPPGDVFSRLIRCLPAAIAGHVEATSPHVRAGSPMKMLHSH